MFSKITLFALSAQHVLSAKIKPFMDLAVPDLKNDDAFVPVSICGKDDSIEAKCGNITEPAAYQASRAVLRITRSGSAHCTGWLVGDQGHILTNNHCASSPSSANSLRFEAMAEGATCATNCKRSLACSGVVIHAKPLEFVVTGANTDNDWTLFKLPPDEAAIAVAKYGYLRIRKAGAVEGERIYIAGHPRGYGKRLSFMDGAKNGTVISRDYDTGCGTSELIYKVDTEGGNSGSPILSYVDHTVVGIHHCGGCTEAGNSGVDVDKMYEGLKDYLPDSAWV
jgi:V8-like Glu-specific endopeptidase